MKQLKSRSFGALREGACRLAAVAAVSGMTLLGQTIPNPSFEADTFTVWPGYISGNAPITGWTANVDTRAGLNPAAGTPFADNGTIPQGSNVAFIQSDEGGAGVTLGTTISGLTAGTTYKLAFRANARGGQAANLRILIDDVDLVGAEGVPGVTIYPVTGTSPYSFVAFEFTASAASQTLTLLNDSTSDNTVLVDDFSIAPTSGRWVVAPWTGDEDSGVDANYVYTHAYNFGSADSPAINGITFTGLAGGNPGVAGRFSTTYLVNLFTGDNDAALTGGSKILGRDFVYGGTVPAGSFQSITIEGLTAGTEYVATIYSVGFDPPGPTIRWATFSVGNDRLTVNQDQFFNNGGILLSYRYTADASGSVTLNYAPINPANVSIHTYGFSNREAVSRNVAPEITGQPLNQTVTVGLPATFTVAATGIPAPTYQWRFKGANIGGATEASYTIPATAATDVGDYDVVVRNSMGTVTSNPVKLTIGIPLLNPSFEEDVFTVWPGYVSGNVPITGWEALGGHGLNPVEDGQSPFADNGAIPHGRQVALMQENGALSQTVTGLSAGAQYYLHYYENARTVVTVPSLEVRLGETTLVPMRSVPPVGGGQYREIYSDVFAATTAEAVLSFIKGAPQGGDCTALVDNVAIVQVPAGTVPFVTVNPRAQKASVGESASFSAQAIGSLPLALQWLKNGEAIAGATSATLQLDNVQEAAEADYSLRISNAAGSVTTAAARLTVYEPIPDLYNTGLDANRAPLAEGAVDPHWRLIDNPDTGSNDAIVEGALPGAWMANTTTSQWVGPQLNTVGSAIGIYTYRTTIDLTDRDPSTVIIEGRWATDNTGRAIRVNGVATANLPNTAQFASWTAFTLDGQQSQFVAGPNTLEFVVENEAAIGYTGLRVEFVRSNVKIPPGVPPEILTHPLSQTVTEGSTVTLVASAGGTAPLSFQWSKDGVTLPGQTGLTLTLTNVKPEDSGAYTFTASNALGSATSNPGNLCVCLVPVPGIFGTGLDATGALLADGDVDPHYTMTSSPDGDFPGPEAYAINAVWPIQAGVWLLNGPASRWIGPQASQTTGNAPGDYTYHTEFDLTGIDLAKFRLIGGWTSDNAGTAVLLNGTATGLSNTGAFGSLTPFTITTGFANGVNTLDFVVNNAGDALNPTGLRVDLKGYLYTEPAAKAVLKITRDGANLSISWSPTSTGQKLQSATAVTGPWADVQNATNPYVTAATGTAQYFRVIIP